MIGFRGAARYSHPAYAEGFAFTSAGDETRWAVDDMALIKCLFFDECPMFAADIEFRKRENSLG